VASEAQSLQLQQTLYQSRNPTRRWLHCSRRDWVVSQLQQVGPVERALEVGPGSGVYLPALCAQAEQVDASDIHPEYLQAAQALCARHSNLQCMRDDIRQTRLPARQYSLVLCSEVIEHLPDSAAALSNMAALLSDDGVLILTTPQRYSPLELCAQVAFLPGVVQLVRWIYGEPVEPTGHINLLSASALGQQFERTGLVAQSSYRCGFYLPLLAEFGGVWGQRLLARCARWLARGRFAGLLWTQCYVLRRAT
jgi:SAM-dependent methyltransferase